MAGGARRSALPASGPPGLLASGGIVIVADRDRWNALVLEFPDAALEQAFEWGEVLRASHARPYRLAVLADQGCAAAMAILAWRIPLLRLSVLYAPRGPLLVGDDDGVAKLVTAVRTTAASTGAVFLRASPGVTEDPSRVHEQLVRHGFVHLEDDWTIWNSPKIVMTLGLNGSERDVWSRLSNSRRRDIRAAEAAGVTIEPARVPADLDLFHHLVAASGRRKIYPVRSCRHFASILSEYRSPDVRLFTLARYRGQVVGGLLAVRFGRSAYFLYSVVERGQGSPTEAVYPGPLLYWHFIRWAKMLGCETIQWGGSGTQFPPHSVDPGYGLYQFKRSFGSACVACLGYYDLVFRPAFYAAFRTAERRLGPAIWKVRAKLNR